MFENIDCLNASKNPAIENSGGVVEGWSASRAAYTNVSAVDTDTAIQIAAGIDGMTRARGGVSMKRTWNSRIWEETHLHNVQLVQWGMIMEQCKRRFPSEIVYIRPVSLEKQLYTDRGVRAVARSKRFARRKREKAPISHQLGAGFRSRSAAQRSILAIFEAMRRSSAVRASARPMKIWNFGGKMLDIVPLEMVNASSTGIFLARAELHTAISRDVSLPIFTQLCESSKVYADSPIKGPVTPEDEEKMRKLLPWHLAPEYLRHNPYILSGYRAPAVFSMECACELESRWTSSWYQEQPVIPYYAHQGVLTCLMENPLRVYAQLRRLSQRYSKLFHFLEKLSSFLVSYLSNSMMKILYLINLNY
ncbi:unnamed protein product, partial [Trichogramma brassicae]